MQYIEKLEEDFVREIKTNRPYATSEEITYVLKGMNDLLDSGFTPEEMVESMIGDINEQLFKVMTSGYPIPGYTVGVNTDRVNLKFYGGYLNSKGVLMPDNAIFDIASMSKMYTQVIAYNLIADKDINFQLNSKVKDLCPNFSKTDELTIRDIMSFGFGFGGMDDFKQSTSIADAKQKLYNIEIGVNKENEKILGRYVYQDYGMMILKETMEYVTNMSYEELLTKYITGKLQLDNTFVNLPSDKLALFTGSPNDKLGLVNDQKAMLLGGNGGHAGIKASSDDINRFSRALLSTDGIMPRQFQSDLYTPSSMKDNRGISGNTYVPTSKGLDNTYILRTEGAKAFAYQGSNRVQANVRPYTIDAKEVVSTSTILFNPGSMVDIKIEGYNKVDWIKEYKLSNNQNSFVEIDLRKPVPAAVMDPLTEATSNLNLRLLYMDYFITKTTPNYDKSINMDVVDEKVYKK